jgi:MHS family proline/betaine transporter-like MFS transporter
VSFAAARPIRCSRQLAYHITPLIVLLVLAAVGASFAIGVFGAVVADLFPTHVRYSGIALAYNISFTAFSGNAPLLATIAISATGSAAAPALVMAGCAALTLFGSLWIGQHGGRVEIPGNWRAGARHTT